MQTIIPDFDSGPGNSDGPGDPIKLKVMDMCKRLKRKSGFTLIELMITTVIVGIVASMAVPKVQKAYEKMQFTSSHRELVSSLRLARSMAVTEKTPYGVYLDPEAMTITLFKDMASTGYEFSAGTDSTIRVDSLPKYISYLASDLVGNTIFFSPNGSADFSGGGNIFVIAYSPDILGIFWTNILASTGRIDSDYAFY